MAGQAGAEFVTRAVASIASSPRTERLSAMGPEKSPSGKSAMLPGLPPSGSVAFTYPRPADDKRANRDPAPLPAPNVQRASRLR